jgi:hypothetical protein
MSHKDITFETGQVLTLLMNDYAIETCLVVEAEIQIQSKSTSAAQAKYATFTVGKIIGKGYLMDVQWKTDGDQS